MSEQKYYVRLSCCAYINQKDGCVLHKVLWLDCDWEFVEEDNRHLFTKSELSKIMDGVLYRTFAHQFDPELAEELYKLGYRTTQTTEEWIEARYEFDNIWEWINPLIELVPVEEE